MYTKRNRFVMLFLMGGPFRVVYNYYWIASVQNEVRQNRRKGLGGLGTVLLVFCTFGLYSIIWQFRTSGILKKQGAKGKRIKITSAYMVMKHERFRQKFMLKIKI